MPSSESELFMDFYLGQIVLFAGDFAPTGWMACNGQLMNIQQNSALFSLLGTTYGGDGTTTFALPKMSSPAEDGDGPAYLICVHGMYPSRD